MALIIGNGFIVDAYHPHQNISFWTLLPIESRGLVVVVGIGVLTSWEVYQLLHQTGFYVSGLLGSLLIYVMVVSGSFWCHPLRKTVNVIQS